MNLHEEIIDERLISKSRKIKEKEELKKIEDLTTINNMQIVYTYNQLARAMPGFSVNQIKKLVDEKKIRTLPAGTFNARWEVIPHVTLMEDLRRLVETYNF